jgi:hypothetical protein
MRKRETGQFSVRYIDSLCLSGLNVMYSLSFESGHLVLNIRRNIKVIMKVARYYSTNSINFDKVYSEFRIRSSSVGKEGACALFLPSHPYYVTKPGYSISRNVSAR